jgi:hypothetical protein
MEERSILKSKTFWAAIVQFLTAFVSWVVGDISLWMLILDLVAMLGIIFYRDSIEQNLRNFLNRFEWFRSRTAWAAIATMLGFVSAWLAGEIQLSVMLISVFTAFIGIFLRSAQSPENA